MMLVLICHEGRQLEMVNFLCLLYSFFVNFQIYLTFFVNSTGPPELVFDWTQELDSELSNQDNNNQAFSRKHWRLLQCQNGKCSNCIHIYSYVFACMLACAPLLPHAIVMVRCLI